MKIFVIHFRKIIPVLMAGILLLAVRRQANAQQWGNSSPQSDPFESQYFTNRYLGNPALAGLDSTLNLNAAFRKQFQGIPGAPATQAFTADYNPGKRVGLGLIAYNDKAALINRSRFALTYAYHLPIGKSGQQLHFGISGAFVHSSLDPKDIVGDQTDPAIANFNSRKNAFEADYGMAYTDPHLTLQASLTNLISYFKNISDNTADVSTFYLASSYKFIFNSLVNSVEPEVCLRGVKKYTSIVDMGANLAMFNHILNIYGMYHSSGNFSTGVGVNYKSILYIQGSYLSQTTGLRNYTNGSFEVDVAISILRNKHPKRSSQ